MIFLIFEKPAIATRLRTEIKEVIKGDADITFDNIKKLGYLDCILLEVSRVFCVLPGYFQR